MSKKSPPHKMSFSPEDSMEGLLYSDSQITGQGLNFDDWLRPGCTEDAGENITNGEMDDLQYLQFSRESNPYTYYIDEHHLTQHNFEPTDQPVSPSSSGEPQIHTPSSSPPSDFSSPGVYTPVGDHSPLGDHPPLGDYYSPGDCLLPVDSFSTDFLAESPISLVSSPLPTNFSPSPVNPSPPYVFNAVPDLDELEMVNNIDPALENQVLTEINEMPYSPLVLELSETPTSPEFGPFSTPAAPAALALPSIPSSSAPLHPSSPTPSYNTNYRIAVSPPSSDAPEASPSVGSPLTSASPRNGRGRIGTPPQRRRRPSNPSGITKKYRCDFPGCLKVCERPCDLKKHKKRHEKPFDCRYKGCDSCGFSTEKDRERHEKSKHKKNEHLICIRCGHTTARKDNMKDHVRRRHSDYDLKGTMDCIMKTEGAGCASPSDQD